jgi:hypothetical protein
VFALERPYASGLPNECNVRYRWNIGGTRISGRVHSRPICRWYERSTLCSFPRHLASAARILVQVAAQNVTPPTPDDWHRCCAALEIGVTYPLEATWSLPRIGRPVVSTSCLLARGIWTTRADEDPYQPSSKPRCANAALATSGPVPRLSLLLLRSPLFRFATEADSSHRAERDHSDLSFDPASSADLRRVFVLR